MFPHFSSKLRQYQKIRTTISHQPDTAMERRMLDEDLAKGQTVPSEDTALIRTFCRLHIVAGTKVHWNN